MTIFALEQCVENGVDLNISDAESALAELNTLRDQLAKAQKDAERLRGALEALADYVDERTGDSECRPLENARTTLAAIDAAKEQS